MNSAKKRGRLVIISAPSGTGKTTVIRRFLYENPNMIHSISCTTRPIRPGEINGKDYHFMDERKFRDGVANDKFAEWAGVHNYLYGTPREQIEGWINEGKDVLLDLDVVGGLRLRKLYKDDSISIFLAPPSMDELKRRLFERATDSKEVQELRLTNALKEMEFKGKYDHQIVNDDLERAYKEIERILAA